MTRKRLRIADGVTFPLEVVTETISVLAKRGAGKTHTAAVIVEEMLAAGAQVVVIDPMGAWWGLRSSADSKGPGYSIAILGADGAPKRDIRLEHTGGALVAETIVSTGISAVLDVSGFSKGQRKRFVQDFAETLYRKNREPIHIVLEEADLFAPQKPIRGEEPMLGAIEDLVRRGRGKGIGVTLICQRSAVLNKDVLSQTEILVVLRTTSPHDRDAVEAWLEWHLEKADLAAIMREVPTLATGEAYIVSPAVLKTVARVQIRKRTTYDSSATPKAGQRKREPRKLADVDLGELEAAMVETVEREKANDPKELKRRIRELEQEVASRPEVEREPPTIIELPVLEIPKLDAKIGELAQEFTKWFERVESGIGKMEEILADVVDAEKRAKEIVASARKEDLYVHRHRELEELPKPRPVRRIPKENAATDERDESQLAGGEETILRTISERSPLELTRSQVAALSGYSPRSSTFEGHLAGLRRRGFIVSKDGRILITEAGIQAAGIVHAIPTTPEEILEGWKSVLPTGARKMLEVLVKKNGIERDALFVAAGFSATSSTPQEHLATLRRNSLVVSENGYLYPSEELTGV